jgi:hypothetical protein
VDLRKARAGGERKTVTIQFSILLVKNLVKNLVLLLTKVCNRCGEEGRLAPGGGRGGGGRGGGQRDGGRDSGIEDLKLL